MTRKTPGIGGLLLLGAAAFGAYKYSKMSEQEKRNLTDKGKRFFNDNVAGAFKKKNASQSVNGTV